MNSIKELRHRVANNNQHSPPFASNGVSHRRSVPNTAAPSSPSRRTDHRMIHDEESGEIIGNSSTAVVDDHVKTSTPSNHHHHGHHHSHSHEPLSPPYDTRGAVDDENKTIRSKTLFFKTIFWISAWYTTSLTTLFLNKIILSRPNSSVHVLGMCQMTTAAVLGGWTAYGGGEWVQFQFSRLVELVLPKEMQSIVQWNKQRKVVIEYNRQQSSSETIHTNPDSNTNRNNTFLRDMSIVGLLRGLTVVLGLIALEHVPVSFVETIKSTAPAFTVLFARLILKEHTSLPVTLTLIPIVVGLILCSASELRFDGIGFAAAVLNNCADCIQNVMSKRMLMRMKPTKLQFYTSVAALVLQCPFVLRDLGEWVRGYGWSSGPNDDVVVGNHHHDTNDGNSTIGIGKLLLLDAISYHLQSVSAYCTMSCMSPVSQSVANTLKRSLLVWASIVYFGNPITGSGVVGIILVVGGVFLYNHVRSGQR